MKEAPRIAFSWHGLQQFSARQFRSAIDLLGCECIVVGSPPEVPVEGMERALRGKIHWIDAQKSIAWNEIGLAPPDIFFQAGWGYPAFMALGREVKARGGHVVCLSDATWRGNFRQLVLGPISFALKLRSHFDAVLVPGENGRKLMRYFGMPSDRIYMGALGADPILFNGGPPLSQRPKRFLFVGRFVPTKNVPRLVEAFLRFSSKVPGWELQMVGSGARHTSMPRVPNLIIDDFVQPEHLSAFFKGARFFVLPSKAEAWGLAVHEAALCGCALLLSETVGSGPDLCAPENSLRFRPSSVEAIEQAFVRAALFSDMELEAAETKSRALAVHFGPERFAKEIQSIVIKLCQSCS